MRLFDIRPPSDLNGDRTLSRCRTPTALSATSKGDRGKRRWETPQKSQRKNKLFFQSLLGDNPMLCSSSHAWETPCFLQHKKVQHATLIDTKFVATFGVERFTLQTRKLWLVGVATDRDALHACLRIFSFYFSCFFPAQKIKNKKIKKEEEKTSQNEEKETEREKKKRPARRGGGTHRDRSKIDFKERNDTINRARFFFFYKNGP